jgi:hypothetical protein
MERRPANFNFDRRSASYKRWPRRCDGFRAYSIASARKPAQQLDRRRQSCKRSAAYADANAAARAPRTVRSDSTNVVVPLVQDELQAWPARCAILIYAARSCTDAVRVAIRPSTVHAELQTLCSNALADWSIGRADWCKPAPLDGGVAYRLGSFIIKTASSKKNALADSAALVKLAPASQFEARRPSQRSAAAHRNPAC